MMKKKLIMAVAILVILAALLLVPAKKLDAGIASEAYEQQFVTLINNLRASVALPPLGVTYVLTSGARAWAEQMAQMGNISHDPNLKNSVSDYDMIGENVGMGGSVKPIFDAFVASPAHYANLVRPNFSQVGVGVIVEGSTLFTVERFLDPVDGPVAPPAPTVAPTTAAPTTVPPTTQPPTTTARPTTTINPVCVAS